MVLDMTNYNIQADILTLWSQGYEEILEQQKFQTQETEEDSSLQTEESRVPKNDLKN
jgi:hypothetical protein